MNVEKNEKGERKKEENYIKKGEKGLLNASFWAINSKNWDTTTGYLVLTECLLGCSSSYSSSTSGHRPPTHTGFTGG